MTRTRRPLVSLALAAAVAACAGGDAPPAPPDLDGGASPPPSDAGQQDRCLSLADLRGGWTWIDYADLGDDPSLCQHIDCDVSFASWNGALHIDDTGTLRMALHFVQTYAGTGHLYVHLVGRARVDGCERLVVEHLYDYADRCYRESRLQGSWGVDPEEIDGTRRTLHLTIKRTSDRRFVMLPPLDYFGGKIPWERAADVTSANVDLKYDPAFRAPRCDPVATGACECWCTEPEHWCADGERLTWCTPPATLETEPCDRVCARDGLGEAMFCSTDDTCVCDWAVCDAPELTFRCAAGDAQVCLHEDWIPRACEDMCLGWGYPGAEGCELDSCRCAGSECSPARDDFECLTSASYRSCRDEGWWWHGNCDPLCVRWGYAESDGCTSGEGCACVREGCANPGLYQCYADDVVRRCDGDGTWVPTDCYTACAERGAGPPVGCGWHPALGHLGCLCQGE